MECVCRTAAAIVPRASQGNNGCFSSVSSLAQCLFREGGCIIVIGAYVESRYMKRCAMAQTL